MISFEKQFLPQTKGKVDSLGRWILLNIRSIGMGLLILFESLSYIIHLPKRRYEFGRQLMNAGLKSLFITSVVALFTGMILSLQTGIVLRDYGQEVNVGTIVAQTMCREMGPFMTSLILAASVGAAYAAEIGTMTVSEEISALQVMSINPCSFLVMPRLFAMIIMCPVLTIYTDIVGILGGMLVAQTQLNVSTDAYYENAMNMLKNKEIYVGLFKSVIFAMVIVSVSCYQGFATRNGAIGVGKATRTAVVTSFIYILIIGYFITRSFY